MAVHYPCHIQCVSILVTLRTIDTYEAQFIGGVMDRGSSTLTVRLSFSYYTSFFHIREVKKFQREKVMKDTVRVLGKTRDFRYVPKLKREYLRRSLRPRGSG